MNGLRFLLLFLCLAALGAVPATATAPPAASLAATHHHGDGETEHSHQAKEPREHGIAQRLPCLDRARHHDPAPPLLVFPPRCEAPAFRIPATAKLDLHCSSPHRQGVGLLLHD